MTEKLGDVCHISAGGTPSRSIVAYWQNGTIPWVKISDFSGKYLEETEECISKEGLENSSAKMFPEGTILYTIFATLGEVSILKIKAATNQAIAGLQVIDDRLLPEYVYYYLLSIKKQIIETGRGVAQNNINLGILRNLQIRIPMLETQQSIIKMLGRIEMLISMRKKQLQKLDDLIKSRFVEMFGDPKTNTKNYKIKRISELFDVGSSKRVFESQWRNTGIPFYRAREIVKLARDGFVDNELFIEKSMYEDYKKKYGVPKENDMMVTGVGTLGVCYIVKGTDKFYFKDGNILWFKNKGLCDVRFIKDQFETDYVKDQIVANANVSTVGTYTITNANNTLVLVPPIGEQYEYVTYCNIIDKQKTRIQQGLEKLEQMKQTLMQKYFG